MTSDDPRILSDLSNWRADALAGHPATGVEVLELLDHIDAITEQRDKALSFAYELISYAEHKRVCEARWRLAPCTCGLNELLERYWD